MGKSKLFRSLCLHSVVTCHANNTPPKNRHYSDINVERLFQTFVALFPLFYLVSNSRDVRLSWESPLTRFSIFMLALSSQIMSRYERIVLKRLLYHCIKVHSLWTYRIKCSSRLFISTRAILFISGTNHNLSLRQLT